MGNIPTYIKAANSEFKDIKHVPGDKDETPTMVGRFVYWRSCLMGITIFIWVLFEILEGWTLKRAFAARDDLKESIPEVIRIYFEKAVMVPLVIDCLVSGLHFFAFCMCVKAFMVRRSQYILSMQLLFSSWMLMLFAPLIWHVVMPAGAFIDLQLLRRDACSCTLIGILQQGPTVRKAFGHKAQQHEPGLYKTSLGPPPLCHPKLLNGWTGTNWCEANAYSWHKKLFGPMPEGGALSHLMGVGMEPGLITSVLNDLASMWDLSLFDCEGIHDKNAINRVPAALEEFSSNHSRKDTHRGHHGRLLRRDDSLEVIGNEQFTTTVAVDAQGEIEQQEETDFSSLLHTGQKTMSTIDEHVDPSTIPLQGGGQVTSDEMKARGQTGICAAYRAITGLSSVSVIAPQSIVTLFSMLQGGKIIGSGLPMMLSFVPSVALGVTNVKMVLRSSSLPGYLLGMLVLGSLPPTVIVVALVSQAGGCWSMAWTCFFFLLTMVHVLKKAKIFTSDRGAKTLKKHCEQLDKENLILKFMTALGLIVFVGWKMYLYSKGNLEMGDALSFTRQMLLTVMTPSFVMAAGLRYLLFSYLCIAASADLCMFLIFEIMDDDLKVKKKGEEEDEDQEELFIDWNELVGKDPPDIKSKKKKKDKKEKKDSKKDTKDGTVKHKDKKNKKEAKLAKTKSMGVGKMVTGMASRPWGFGRRSRSEVTVQASEEAGDYDYEEEDTGLQTAHTAPGRYEEYDGGDDFAEVVAVPTTRGHAYEGAATHTGAAGSSSKPKKRGLWG